MFIQQIQVFHKLLIIMNKDYVGVCVYLYQFVAAQSGWRQTIVLY